MTGIIDYGAGNLRSVEKAVRFIGGRTVVSGDPSVLSGCSRLVLPGVGAFPAAMERLRAAGLCDFIRDYAGKKPLLGICLGMQLLFSRSFEFCQCEGLSLIEGEVVGIQGNGLKVPHMGWNELVIERDSRILKGVKQGDYMYFVHSFYAVVKRKSNLLASVSYGEQLTAVTGRDNVYGIQFHPEKSGDAGLLILRNFIEMGA